MFIVSLCYVTILSSFLLMGPSNAVRFIQLEWTRWWIVCYYLRSCCGVACFSERAKDFTKKVLQLVLSYRALSTVVTLIDVLVWIKYAANSMAMVFSMGLVDHFTLIASIAIVVTIGLLGDVQVVKITKGTFEELAESGRICPIWWTRNCTKTCCRWKSKRNTRTHWGTSWSTSGSTKDQINLPNNKIRFTLRSLARVIFDH